MTTHFPHRYVSVCDAKTTIYLAVFTLLIVGIVAPAIAQDQTISGNLGVSGILDVNGDNFNLGTSAFDVTKYGVSAGYGEDATTHAATLSLTATRPSASWIWQQAVPSPGTGSVPKMQLSAGNALTLYDQASPTPNATIILDPLGTSTFGTSTTFNGMDNEMPNQTVMGAGSVLTVSIGDGRYILQGTNSSLTLGYQATASGVDSTALGASSSATGPYSTALGYGSVANNGYTAALGNGSQASGSTSTALGTNSAATADNTTTVGNSSVATNWGASAFGLGSQALGLVSNSLGAYSQAAGNYSTALGASSSAAFEAASALGVYSKAWGTYSTALGYQSMSSNYAAAALGAFSTASGYLSTSLGDSTVASGTGTVAIGHNSTASGVDAVTIGAYSVASGDASTSTGVTTATSYNQFTVGRYNVTGGDPNNWVATDDLFTVGNGQLATAPSNALSVKKNGDMTVNGNLNVTKAIIVQPQGDLSMGTFTAQPSPTP